MLLPMIARSFVDLLHCWLITVRVAVLSFSAMLMIIGKEKDFEWVAIIGA